MREKRLPFSDADAGGGAGADEEPAKRPRTRFVELQPSAKDPADAIDDEIPGSVRAGVEPLVLADAPFDPFQPGDPALSASHLAADPGFARAQRAHLRQQQQEQGALGEALKAQEKYDQPEEAQNEVGDYVEPFHLRKELEEGCFDGAGNYLEYEREDEQDAWLDSIEDKVHGVGPDSSARLPYPNEPVAEPPPLAPAQLAPYRQQLLGLLQPGETVPAALRRLAGAGRVLDKFASKEEARTFFQDRVRSGHAVPPGNRQEFEAVTEAAEVLFDQGLTDVYLASKEQLAASFQAAAAADKAGQQAPSPRQKAAAAGSPGHTTEGAPWPGGRGRRHRVPPSAAPAAAAEPPLSPDKPSVPSGEHTGASSRGGAGLAAAAHGFAAEVVDDVQGEGPVSTPPPQEMEVGLGLLSAAPTAVELQSHADLSAGGAAGATAGGTGASGRQQLHERHAQAMPEGQTPLKAALYGSFADRLPPEQQAAAAAAKATQARMAGLGAAGALPMPASAGGTGGALAGARVVPPGAEAAGDQQAPPSSVTDQQLEAAFQEGLHGRSAPGLEGSQQEAGTAGGTADPAMDAATGAEGAVASAHPPGPSAAATVALLGGLVQPAVGTAGGTSGTAAHEAAATLAGRLGSVQRLVMEQGAQASNPAPSTHGMAQQGKQAQQPAAVAFDNEAANLAGATSGPAGTPVAEE